MLTKVAAHYLHSLCAFDGVTGGEHFAVGWPPERREGPVMASQDVVAIFVSPKSSIYNSCRLYLLVCHNLGTLLAETWAEPK